MPGRISLTFDDGMDCQVKYAVPLLNEFEMKGTFFLCGTEPQPESSAPLLIGEWIYASIAGHEIGSHSVNHPKAATLDASRAEFECVCSKKWLEDIIGVGITSFCYPYTDAPPLLQNAVRKAGYQQARGGRVARPNKYHRRGDGANLFDVTCFHVGPQTIAQGAEWVKTAEQQDAWLTLMFHGINAPDKWDNITIESFAHFLDMVDHSSVDVVTFAKGAEWYRSSQ